MFASTSHKGTHFGDLVAELLAIKDGDFEFILLILVMEELILGFDESDMEVLSKMDG